MAVNFVTATPRSSTRLRLLFDNTLAAGAFVTGFYTVTSIDGIGADPDVDAALIIADTPQGVELVLSEELVGGGLYQLDVDAGVPATDASTAPAAVLQFRPGAASRDPSPEVNRSDVLREIFGEDIVWDGTDWAEDAEGDLEGITGPSNAREAVERRLESEGLLWNEDYGLRGREFVDGPAQLLPFLRGRIVSQALRDDRVVKANAGVVDPEDAGEPTRRIRVSLVLVGNVPVEVISTQPEDPTLPA